MHAAADVGAAGRPRRDRAGGHRLSRTAGTLLETAPGVSVEEVMAATEAELTIPDKVPEMKI